MIRTCVVKDALQVKTEYPASIAYLDLLCQECHPVPSIRQLLRCVKFITPLAMSNLEAISNCLIPIPQSVGCYELYYTGLCGFRA